MPSLPLIHGFLELCIVHQPLELSVFLIKLLGTFDLTTIYSPLKLPPAVVRGCEPFKVGQALHGLSLLHKRLSRVPLANDQRGGEVLAFLGGFPYRGCQGSPLLSALVQFGVHLRDGAGRSVIRASDGTLAHPVIRHLIFQKGSGISVDWGQGFCVDCHTGFFCPLHIWYKS